MIDFAGSKKIYFVGIGGIGMSACAGLAAANGYDVSGSDSKDIYDPSKSVLDAHEIKYFIGYDSNNFQGADILVATAAEDDQNPEVFKAKSMGVPVIGYPEFLNWIAKDKKQIIVVGTHGKGTTSGLLGFALKKLEDSGFFVGAVLSDLKTNFYWGKGPHFVIEGDEYKTSSDDMNPKFMYYKPYILLINNIEFDHPDIYPNIEAFKKPFIEFVKKLDNKAIVVFNSDDKNASDIASTFSGKKIGFSLQVRPEYKLPGTVYAYDYSAGIAVLEEIGYEYENIKNIIAEYSGVKRRYEIIHDNGITVIDDYAHHPTAVRATLEATREKYPGRRIVCFFEPHTYSRTQETLSELKNAFAAADLVYIAEVYPAREQKLESSITGSQVVKAVSENHQNVSLVHDKQDALKKYQPVNGDVVIVMAVGSFNTLSYDLARRAK